MSRPVDVTVLRAIAHPVRNRVLTELRATGPMRAADVASALDIPANQASFHLRQLAKYGLVEEAPELARDGRDRVWRADADGLEVNGKALAGQPGGREAVQVYMSTAAAEAHGYVDAAYAVPRDDEAHRSTIVTAVRLTQEEARELTDQLSTLFDQWVARTQGTGDGASDERRTYLAHVMLMPHPAPQAAERGEA
ncbi:ArsR/SmtB family transcription factor [Nocardioides acrostichi]|uniref:Helix-turn-helix transcriptional regulator n=1 Tax=Nocardioides acrostichi TaxID=2784339 RepID=A0A930V2L3_9ACTN|nr:helix-turn-helix domain-containing protein [Nocardioides acrostichi]MBF4162647.1 helix-turn-helix transcriptional regulator [Nocardioides acrostichi]